MTEVIGSVVEYIKDLPHVVKLIALIFSVAIEYILPIYPGDTIVVLAGFLNAQGAFGVIDISVAIVVGSVIGALSAYGLGLLIHNKQNKYPLLKKIVTSDSFKKFNAWYKKWGTTFLILNRFFSGVRALFFIAAGTAKLPLTRVLLFGGLSAILFNGCLILLGYWLGYNAELILKYLYRYNMVFYAVLGIGICGFAGYLFYKHRQKKIR